MKRLPYVSEAMRGVALAFVVGALLALAVAYSPRDAAPQPTPAMEQDR